MHREDEALADSVWTGHHSATLSLKINRGVAVG